MAEKSRSFSARKLLMGFIFVILIFLAFGIISLFEMRTLSKVTRTLYDHPLVVSNASLHATVSMTKMHRDMKDVTLSDSPLAINTAINKVNEQERLVYKNLDTLKDNILGVEGRQLENKTRHLFIDWKPIREEVIKLVRKGQREEAAKITTGKGADHVAKLENKMMELTSYARNKATGFMQHGEKVRLRVENTTIILMLIGTFLSIFIAVFTIKRTQAAEEALKESQDRLSSFMDSATDGFILFDSELNYIDINKSALEITGLDRKEFIGKNILEVVPNLKETGRYDKYKEVIKTGVPLFISDLIPHPKFGIKHVEVKAFKVGNGLGIIFTDITVRIQADEALRESEERHRLFFENCPIGIIHYTSEGTVTAVNDAVIATFGSSCDKLIGLNIDDIPDKRLSEAVSKSLNGELGYYEGEYMSYTGGKSSVIRNTSIPIIRNGKVIAGVGIIEDTTERRQMDDLLRESEERYRSLFERSLEFVYLCDFEGNFIDANDAALEGLGYTRKDIKYLNFTELLDERQLSGAFKAVEEVLKTDSQKEVVEYKLRRKDGEHIYVESKGALIYRDGKPFAIQGIARNITDRKLSEEALRESEEKYRSMMEAMIEPIYICSQDFRVEYMNPAMIRRTGRDATGEDCFKTLHDLEEKCPWCMHDKAQQDKYIELEIVSAKDNRSYSISQSPVAHGDGSVSKLTIFRDITEIRETQAQLHRAQKMEAMGLLAGGVAHDLNNILSGIVSYPELLLMDLPEDSPLRKPIEVIQESGMRAADVVEDLLTIARGVATGKEALNLNTIVTEYLESPEYQTLEKTHSFVNLKTEIDPDLLNMSGSPTHIKKTLMNLVLNSSEAIEGAGTVTISTMSRYLDEPLKGYEDVRTGEYAVLSVSDDGSGITPKDLERIFEPFYTKKVMGRSGTGLGLAVVWNTVQDHNGYINVNTSKKGTVFELYFPVTRDEVTAEKEKAPLEDYLGHGEKILVVDDEERQRMIASGMLTKLGYNPEAVSSGEEAIEYMKENAVDLIVLDMVMPKGINGRKTYEEIIKIRPGQKAIIASGFSETEDVKIAQRLGAGKYIKKPYTLEKIGIAVKKELEK